jgi:hypothetical protein
MRFLFMLFSLKCISELKTSPSAYFPRYLRFV